MVHSTGTTYYESDGLWSITSTTAPNSTLTNTYAYDSFGKLTAFTGTIANPFRYTSRELDGETNLQFSRHRYYDATIGRFTGEDGIKFEGKNVNLYWYAKNNSVNLIDPLGLFPETCVTCAEAAAGAWWMWDGYERMKQRNWKGDDKYYHCMANWFATDSGAGGAIAAKVISFFRTDVSSRFREPDDWKNDDKANKCGQQGGNCDKVCAPFVPKASPGKSPFPGW